MYIHSTPIVTPGLKCLIGVNGIPAARLVLLESIEFGNILFTELEIKDLDVGLDA